MVVLESAIALLHYGNSDLSGPGHAALLFSQPTPSNLFTRDTLVRAGIMGLGGLLESPGTILKQQQKINVQILSAVAASISVLSCLLALYWFLLLHRNFRRTYVVYHVWLMTTTDNGHRLVLLLILSDLFKSLWMLIFPAVSLATGGVATGDAFCNAGGFLLQLGMEACGRSIQRLFCLFTHQLQTL